MNIFTNTIQSIREICCRSKNVSAPGVSSLQLQRNNFQNGQLINLIIIFSRNHNFFLFLLLLLCVNANACPQLEFNAEVKTELNRCCVIKITYDFFSVLMRMLTGTVGRCCTFLCCRPCVSSLLSHYTQRKREKSINVKLGYVCDTSNATFFLAATH